MEFFPEAARLSFAEVKRVVPHDFALTVHIGVLLGLRRTRESGRALCLSGELQRVSDGAPLRTRPAAISSLAPSSGGSRGADRQTAIVHNGVICRGDERGAVAPFGTWRQTVPVVRAPVSVRPDRTEEYSAGRPSTPRPARRPVTDDSDRGMR